MVQAHRVCQMIQPTGYPQPIQLCSMTSQFATLAEMRAHYKGLEETRAREVEIRTAELETQHWRRIMADLPTESKAGREKRLAALKADEEERERIIKELKETSDALRKQKTHDTQKRIRQQRSQDKKRWVREVDEQRRVEAERLAAREAKVKEVEAKRVKAAQQKEVARRNEVLRKAVETIYKIHLTRRRTAFTSVVAATLSTWRTTAMSTTRHAPTCGCCADKPRRNRKKSTKAPKKPATGDAIAKADTAMAALIAEEEAVARPKLSKKQKKALAAERLAAETKRLEEEALAKERALAEAKAAREKEINDDLDRQHQETIRKHRRQAELDRMRRQEERAAEWVAHSDKKDRRSTIKRWRPCRSVELGRPCNRGDACRSAHSIDELTIERCRFHNCGRITRRPDGAFYNVDNNRPCNYIHEEERQDNYLQRLGMHVFIRGDRERRPASRAR